VTAVGFADWGQGGYGGLSGDAGTGGPPAVPWDMAGDWDSPSRTGVSDAWAASPLETAKSPEGAGRRDDPVRRTGQQAAVPETSVPESPALGTPVPKTSVPESPALGTPVPETQPPWETGPQRAPWESGPQAAASSTGTQPRYRWGSGPQAPVAPTGAQPASRTGAQPVAPTGTQPVAMAPWESGDWGRVPDWDAAPDNQAAIPAEPEWQPETGSGAWPVTGQPAKPERHSHRAAKHGRPRRWRGSGNRSSGDGES
jgi:hypothetical protein